MKTLRCLYLPFFVLQLLTTALPSLLLLLVIKLLPYRSLLTTILLAGFLLIMLNFQPEPDHKPFAVNPDSNTNSNLLSQKNQLESWLEKQPTHRDILINLSQVHQALGNTDQAQKYYTQAQQLDPNHSYFKN